MAQEPTNKPAEVEPHQQAREHRQLMDQVFRRELDEVYLLLDFISGRADKNLSQLTLPNPEPNKPDWTPQEIVTRLALIRYPPNKDDDQRAADAAFLALVKDQLTTLASPARAVTIAYTELFTGVQQGPSPWHRLISWVARLFGRPGYRSGRTRTTLASNAFPGLPRQVLKFNLLFVGLVCLTIFWMLLTAITYWDVAFGRSLLLRIDNIHKQRATFYQTVPELTDDQVCRPPPKSEQAAPGCKQLEQLAADEDRANLNRSLISIIQEKRQSLYQKDPSLALNATCRPSPAEKFISNCKKLEDLGQQERFAAEDLKSFRYSDEEYWTRILHVLNWHFLISGLKKGNMVEEAPVSALLSLFSNYVLPMMFGVLGTFIATIRSVQAKVSESELSPRDFWSTILAMPLGMVAGVAVGLFFSPATAPETGGTGNPLAGNLTMTASGLGFLAGYGSKAFFNMLDSLLTKAFPTNETVLRPAGPPSQPTLLRPAAPDAHPGISGARPQGVQADLPHQPEKAG